MARKPATPSDEKFERQDFELFPALEALDKKDYGWYSRLTEEQRKKFAPFILIRWVSAIRGEGMLSAYYTVNTDRSANAYLLNDRVANHPELQWLMLCSVSPGLGKQFHQWIPHLSEKAVTLREPISLADATAYFQKIYPTANASLVKECAQTYVQEQNHKQRLAEIYPGLKLTDIELLSKLTDKQELDEYDRQSGN